QPITDGWWPIRDPGGDGTMLLSRWAKPGPYEYALRRPSGEVVPLRLVPGGRPLLFEDTAIYPARQGAGMVLVLDGPGALRTIALDGFSTDGGADFSEDGVVDGFVVLHQWA